MKVHSGKLFGPITSATTMMQFCQTSSHDPTVPSFFLQTGWGSEGAVWWTRIRKRRCLHGDHLWGLHPTISEKATRGRQRQRMHHWLCEFWAPTWAWPYRSLRHWHLWIHNDTWGKPGHEEARASKSPFSVSQALPGNPGYPEDASAVRQIQQRKLLSLEQILTLKTWN